MACRYDDDEFARKRTDELNLVTALLCAVMARLNQDTLERLYEEVDQLQAWWKKHLLADERRRKEEESRKQAQLKAGERRLKQKIAELARLKRELEANSPP